MDVMCVGQLKKGKQKRAETGLAVLFVLAVSANSCGKAEKSLKSAWKETFGTEASDQELRDDKKEDPRGQDLSSKDERKKSSNSEAGPSPDSTPSPAPEVTPKPSDESDSKPPLLFSPSLGTNSKQGIFLGRFGSWSRGPQVTNGDSTRNDFQLEFALPKGQAPKSFEVISLSPFMKIHGHGVPRAFLPKWAVSGSRVTVSQLGFIMSGPWEVNVRARVDGQEDDIELSVEVP